MKTHSVFENFLKTSSSGDRGESNTTPREQVLDILREYGTLTAANISKYSKGLDEFTVKTWCEELYKDGEIDRRPGPMGSIVYAIRTVPPIAEEKRERITPTGRLACPMEGCEFTGKNQHSIDIHVARGHKKDKPKDLKAALDKVVPVPKKGRPYVSDPQAEIEVLHIDVHDDVPISDYSQSYEVKAADTTKEDEHLAVMLNKLAEEKRRAGYETSYSYSQTIGAEDQITLNFHARRKVTQ